MKNDLTAQRINEVKGDLSQEQFAKLIGSSQSAISKVLSGETPSYTILTGIAEKFNVSVDWLLGFSSRKSLNGYSSYDDTNPTTYADAIALFVDLLKNNSISFERNLSDETYAGPYSMLNNTKKIDLVLINDHFLGDLISSADSLQATNPETLDSWLENVIKNYDHPLPEWTQYLDSCYSARINYQTSLQILKEIMADLSQK